MLSLEYLINIDFEISLLLVLFYTTLALPYIKSTCHPRKFIIRSLGNFFLNMLVFFIFIFLLNYKHKLLIVFFTKCFFRIFKEKLFKCYIYFVKKYKPLCIDYDFLEKFFFKISQLLAIIINYRITKPSPYLFNTVEINFDALWGYQKKYFFIHTSLAKLEKSMTPPSKKEVRALRVKFNYWDNFIKKKIKQLRRLIAFFSAGDIISFLPTFLSNLIPILICFALYLYITLTLKAVFFLDELFIFPITYIITTTPLLIVYFSYFFKKWRVRITVTKCSTFKNKQIYLLK